MKKIVALVIALIIVGALGYATKYMADVFKSKSPEDAGVWLVTADTTAKGAAGQVFAQLIQEKVKNITGGSLVIDYFPNGELGGDVDLLRQAQRGYIAITVCQTAPVVSFVPEMAVFDLPMVFARYDGATINEVLNGDSEFKKEMSKAYEQRGLHLLGFMQNATYRLATANKNLLTLSDFNGLKIRTMENKNHMTFWSAIGASPTPLAWAELYISLQQGIVDAQENAADTCVGANFQEVQNYLACTNHILYCNQICMNAKMYDALSEEHKAALNQAVKEALDEMRPRLEEIDRVNKDKLKAGNMEIIEYDKSFFDDVLAIQGVRDLYRKIDNDTHGLGSILEKSLADVAFKNAKNATPAAEPEAQPEVKPEA